MTSKEKLARIYGHRPTIEGMLKYDTYKGLVSAFGWEVTRQGNAYWYHKACGGVTRSLSEEDKSYLRWLLKDDPIDDETEDEQE